MKTIQHVILLALVSISGIVTAQEYKPFSVRIGIGGVMTSSSFKGGSVIQIEPSYRLKDNLSIGLRMEGMTGGLQTVVMMRTFGINAQRYFSNKDFRPFVGLGAAVYSAGFTAGGNCDCTYGSAAGIPAFYPRIGFDSRHFFFNFEYNFVNSFGVDIYDQSTKANSRGTVYPSYLSVKIGVAIGGGRHKK